MNADVWREKCEAIESELRTAKAFHDEAVRQRDHERWRAARISAALAAVRPTFDAPTLDGIAVAAERYNGAGRDTVLALVAEVRRLQADVKKLKEIESLQDC